MPAHFPVVCVSLVLMLGFVYRIQVRKPKHVFIHNCFLHLQAEALGFLNDAPPTVNEVYWWNVQTSSWLQ